MEFIELLKVKVLEVGCPVDVKVPLKLEVESPAMVKAVPVAKLGQALMQVTVATELFPLMVLMIPPTYAVTT
jgi:hypothetical protein